MELINKFFRRITDDLKQRDLIPLKVLFFVHASTLFVLYPYLTIHMRELGINVSETAIMSAVTPVVSIVMPPLAGMLADKIGNFKVPVCSLIMLAALSSAMVCAKRAFSRSWAIKAAQSLSVVVIVLSAIVLLLALSSVLGGASALLLLLVPVGRITITYPTNVDMTLSCRDSKLLVNLDEEFPCTPLHQYPFDVDMTVRACGFNCDISDEDFKDFNISRATSYAVNIKSNNQLESAVYRYNINKMKETNDRKIDQTSVRILDNDINYSTSVRRISVDNYFFPASEMYTVSCSRFNVGTTDCSFGSNISIIDMNIGYVDEQSFNARIKSHEDGFHIERFNREGDTRDDDIKSVTCVDTFNKNGSNLHIDLFGMRKRKMIKNCWSSCIATTSRNGTCINTKEHMELDPSLTFWAYLAVRVFVGIIGGTAFAMFEGAVIAILREQQADYGLQRIYGSIGGMISSPLSGMLIDYASRGKGYTDFRPAFYLYSALKILSGALMLSINLEFKQPSQNIVDDVITVFKNVEMVALFIACFIMGTAWGYIESFLFWLLQDLGASRSLMGVTITVGGIAGLPLLVMSGPIIHKIGHANVLFIGFIFYAIRLMGYSLIYNPWLCLVFEAMESVTSSLSFTAAVTYAARLSSTTTDTSVQGLLGGVYYGVGRGAGSLVGGYLMKAFGTRTTYQIFSIFTLCSGIIYFLFNKFYLKKRQCEGNDICKKKPKLNNIEAAENNKNKMDLNISIIQLADNDKPVDNNTLKGDKPLNFNDDKETSINENKDKEENDSGVDNLAYNDTETPSNETSKNQFNDKK